MARKSTRNWNYGLTLDEYSDKYKHFLALERDDGVLTVRLHTNDGPCMYTFETHHDLGLAWVDIGRDPENKVIVLTGTDGEWLKFDLAAHWSPDSTDGDPGSSNPSPETADDMTQVVYSDTMGWFQNFLFNIEVPTIGALSHTSDWSIVHTETIYACDLLICSDTTTFGSVSMDLKRYGSPLGGWIAGDGTALALEHLIGARRVAYMVFMGERIDAQTALELGIVNEVHPLEDLLPRAQEMARHICDSAQPHVLRLQSQLFKRQFKKRLVDDLALGLMTEAAAGAAMGR